MAGRCSSVWAAGAAVEEDFELLEYRFGGNECLIWNWIAQGLGKRIEVACLACPRGLQQVFGADAVGRLTQPVEMMRQPAEVGDTPRSMAMIPR